MDLKNIKPDIRHLYDMKDVVYDKKWLGTAPNLELYYMYRGLKKQGELRYDITVMPPKMLGKEFVRTKGNRNSGNFPELYTVLEGKAIFLMQKIKGKSVKDVFAVKVEPKDSITILAECAVVMINPSKETLKTENWVSEKNQNIYQELESMQGMCYFYTTEGWIKNDNYENIPELRFEKPLKQVPKDLSFLKK